MAAVAAGGAEWRGSRSCVEGRGAGAGQLAELGALPAEAAEQVFRVREPAPGGPGSPAASGTQAGEDAVQGGAGLEAGAGGVAGLRDVEAGLADKGCEQAREGVGGQRVDLAVVDGASQQVPQQSEAMLFHQLGPGAVAEHGWAVDQDDALEVAAGAGIQERLEAFAQLIQGADGARGAGELLGDEPVQRGRRRRPA